MATLEAPYLDSRLPFTQGRSSTSRQPISARKKTPAAMRAALEKVRGELGREYDLIIAGKRLRTQDKITSLNPAVPSQIVGLHQKAGREHVEPALQAALRAFASLEPHFRGRARRPVVSRSRFVAPTQV